MTTSYVPALTTPKDRVRFAVGDTDMTDVLLQDEEINAILTQKGNDVLRSSVAILRALSARFSRKADKQVGDLRVSYSQLSQQFTDRANDLLADAANFEALTAAPYAGGLSQSEKEASYMNQDAVQPLFRKGMNRNPATRASAYIPRDRP